MFSLSVLVSLALASLVAAQSSGTALELAAIKAHFKAAGLVPSLLSTFEPPALLNLSYADVSNVSPGQPLTGAQVAPTPSLVVTPANSSVSTSGNFTVAMVDAGPVGTDETPGQTRHWLVNGVTISGTSVSTDSAVAITKYAGPAPPSGSGPHRYVILIYYQPSTFTPPDDLAAPDTPVAMFDFPAYVQSSGLGPLLAATYITVEDGTASASLSPTSAVITSTLVVPSASKASGTSATQASARPTQTGASGSLQVTGGLTMALAAALIVVFV